MQCEAMTIGGRRCRNHALKDDIFCDVHQHDWSRKHLKFQIVLFVTGLIGVIFTFGILYESFVLSAFDINYLRYAEISDMIQSAVSFGGLILFYLFLSMIVFNSFLFLYFFTRLIVKIFTNKQLKRLPVKQRLKIYAVCCYVFCLNFLAYIMLLFPSRMASTSHRILIKREQLIYKHLRILIDSSAQNTLTAENRSNYSSSYSQDFFQEFLLYASLNNHPFFLVIATVVLLSIIVTFVGSGHALDSRRCIDNYVPPGNTLSADTLGGQGLSLEYVCDPKDQTTAQTGSFGNFTNILSRYYDYPLVSFTTAAGETSLLHLASTGRFELFFNSRDKKPFIVPREMLPGLAASFGVPSKSIAGHSNDNAKGRIAPTNSNGALSHAINDLSLTLKDDLKARRSADKRYESLHDDITKLHSKIEQIAPPVAPAASQEQSDMETSSSIDDVMPECWTKPIVSIFNYATSVTIIKDEADLVRLEKLASRLIANNSDFVLIVGYTDITGSSDYNHLLSLRRAEETAFLLIQAGVDRSAIHVVGRGEMQASTLSARRVEIRDCSR